MAGEPKPRTVAGYDNEVTVACERTLVTLYSAFGSLKTTLRLVGGLVPRYLTPVEPTKVPSHAGTSDVDVVLNLEVIAEGNGYASLADQLAARGFTRQVNDGKASSWQWVRKVNDHVSVVVEFLRDAGSADGGKLLNVDGERVSALSVKFAGIVHDWYKESEVSAELLDGGGVSVETIRFADVPAFVTLKALALDDRKENKDAADLIHVIRYAGEVNAVAELFVERALSGKHAEAIHAGIDALRRCFCDDKHSEGYLKCGPVSYAAFHEYSNEDEVVREQRFASALVNALVEAIEARLDAAQKG